MNKSIILVIVLGVVIVVLAGVLMWPKQPQDKSDIKDLSVKAGDILQSPLVVTGQAPGAWYFEASFPVKITDKQGNVLGSSYAQAQGEWMTENFVSFKSEISFSSSESQDGFLVLSKDNPSGLPENNKEIKIPVVLEASEMTKVKAYFNNSKLDPEALCNKVFAVERTIPKIEAVGSAAIWETLKGPTQDEIGQGYFTSINFGAELRGLEITKDGVAKVDFNEQLQEGVGGSCKVSAIRAQITETLKQFPTVKSVVISINGRTEDILQP